MRRVVLAGLLLSLTSCLPVPSARVAAFGDSVTFGYGGRPGGWVKELQRMWHHPICDLGVPGELARQGASRIGGPAGLALDPAAEVVLLLHGGNDMNRAFMRAPCSRNCDPSLVDGKFQAIGTNLRKMRSVAARRHRRVVFATYWPPSPDACSKYDAAEFATFQAFVARLDQEIVSVAAEHGDPVVRLDDLTDLPLDPKNYYDCLHPSGQGYHRIAQRWMQDYALWKPPVLTASDASD